MAYFFGLDFLGSVNLGVLSVELKTTLPIEWEYVCDDVFYSAPYWPQNHNARAGCLNHACLPPTAMPSAVRFKIVDWGITPLTLPSPMLTDPGFIRVSETSRTDEQVVYEGLDGFGQSWRVELRLLRRDVYYARTRAEWDEQAFGAELNVSITAGQTRCILFGWTGSLSGIVPVEDLDNVPAMFRRGLSVPGDPTSRWLVTLELLTQSLLTPCNKEGTLDAPYLWLQAPETTMRDRPPWFFTREAGGLSGNAICQTVGPDRWRYQARIIGAVIGDWASVGRVFCLDFRQFPGGVWTFTHRIRLTNFYAAILAPGPPLASPYLHHVGFSLAISNDNPAAFNLLFSIRPAFPFATILYFDCYRPSPLGNVDFARLEGTIFDGGEIQFDIRIKLIEILPRVGIPLYTARYELVHLGNVYLLRTDLARGGYALSMGIAPLWTRSQDEWPNPAVWVYDPTSGLILSAPWPTIRVNLPIITSP